MEKKRRLEHVLTRAANVLDMPVESVAGVPRIELVGDGELRIENHRGILTYGCEEIHVGGGSLVVKITGADLELRAMSALELLITGKISGVCLE